MAGSKLPAFTCRYGNCSPALSLFSFLVLLVPTRPRSVPSAASLASTRAPARCAFVVFFRAPPFAFPRPTASYVFVSVSSVPTPFSPWVVSVQPSPSIVLRSFSSLVRWSFVRSRSTGTDGGCMWDGRDALVVVRLDPKSRFGCDALEHEKGVWIPERRGREATAWQRVGRGSWGRTGMAEAGNPTPFRSPWGWVGMERGAWKVRYPKRSHSGIPPFWEGMPEPSWTPPQHRSQNTSASRTGDESTLVRSSRNGGIGMMGTNMRIQKDAQGRTSVDARTGPNIQPGWDTNGQGG